VVIFKNLNQKNVHIKNIPKVPGIINLFLYNIKTINLIIIFKVINGYN